MIATRLGRNARYAAPQGVLKKTEGWHQGSIAGYSISYRDTRETGAEV
jgi:hypothetical protein